MDRPRIRVSSRSRLALMGVSVASEPATAVELEEEQRLVEEAQAGNLDAMRPILERYAQPLYGTVILPRLGDTASAEEVLRDTLATAVEKIGRFTWQGKSIYPWLRQIAINKVLRRPSPVEALAPARRRDGARGPAGDRSGHPRRRAADGRSGAPRAPRAHRRALDAARRALPPAIELRLVQELPREECAKRLGVTIGTFDVLLFRAVRAFRKQFGDARR